MALTYLEISVFLMPLPLSSQQFQAVLHRTSQPVEKEKIFTNFPFLRKYTVVIPKHVGPYCSSYNIIFQLFFL